MRGPAPVHPMSLVRRADNPHPALRALRRYLRMRRAEAPGDEVWVPPAWAAR